LRPVRLEHRLLALALPFPGQDADREISAICGRPLDWTLVLDSGERLGALALLGEALRRSGAAVPDRVRGSCQEALTRGLMRVMVARRVMEELRSALGGAGVPFLVLKGLPLACEIYPQPGLRPIGDLDLLVRRGTLDAALEVLRDRGYRPPRLSPPIDFFRRHHFHLTLLRDGHGGFPVELHWDTQPFFSLSRIPETEFWAGARTLSAQGLALTVPAREASFLFLSQHLMRHVLSFGPRSWEDPVAALLEPGRRGRLAWIADLALLARSGPGLDWERVDRLSARWGLHGEIAGLRGYLTRSGVWPGRPAARLSESPSFPAEPEILRRAAALFPGLSRPASALQMRPVLAFRLLRFAFPGAGWIRWRYGLTEGAGRWRVAWRSLVHASGTLQRAVGLAAAVVAFWLRPRRPGREAVPPDRMQTGMGVVETRRSRYGA
jgi:hypothetical protein